MCGLVYLKRKDGHPAAKAVVKRYNKQKARGQQGFGYVAIKDNKVVSYQRAQYWDEIQALMLQEDAPEILFHHRFPTSTANVSECAHPIFVSHESLSHDYYIVHNGVIRNTDALKATHEKRGFVYNTELCSFTETVNGKRYVNNNTWNDSESLAIETALVVDGKKEDIATIGPAAVIGLKVDTDGNVTDRFFYRNYSNPMTIYEDPNMTVISSEGSGSTVVATNIFVLNEDTGFSQYTDLKPPSAYEPYDNSAKYPSSHTYSTNRDHYDDYFDRRDMGFSKVNRTNNNKAIEIYRGEDLGGAEHIKDLINRDSDNGSFITDLANSWDDIKQMAEDELWEAFEVASAQLDIVNEELLKFDIVAMDHTLSVADNAIRDGIVNRKRRLTAETNQYEHALTLINSKKGDNAAFNI